MRLTRDDLTPIFAILVAGSIGAAGTVALLDARSSASRDLRRFEYEVQPVLRLQPTFEGMRPPSFGYTVYGDVIERIEELRLRQHDLTLEVARLERLPPDQRADRILALRSAKDQMLRTLDVLESSLDGAMRAQPSVGGRALERAAASIERSRLEEKLRYSRSTIEQWDPASAVTLEQQIESDLVGLREVFLSNWSQR